MKLSVLKKNQLISEINLSDLVIDGKFTETVFLIGRSKECHVVLDEKQISREHSKLIHVNGKWRIEKLSQETPLMLNNESIETSFIKSGDSVSIGPFVIDFEIPEPNISTPAPVELKVQPIEEVTVAPAPIVETIPVEDEVEGVDQGTHEVSSEESDDGTGEMVQEQESVEPVDDFLLNHDGGHDEVAAQDSLDSFATDSEVTAEAVLDASISESPDDASYSLENISNDDSGGDSTQVFKSFSSVHLELFGEFAPYDKFTLSGGKIFIGRDASKCQIVLLDPEVSSTHAVITKTNMMMTLEDLNSGNGTLLNGERINKATLNHNDEFIIGSTSFKVKVDSEFLQEELATLMPVDEDQEVEIEEVVEVQAEEGESINALGEVTSNEPQEKSVLKRIWKDEANRKKLIYGAVILVGAWVMFGDEDPPPKPVAKKEAKSKDLKDEKTEKSDKGDSKKTAGRILSDEEKRALSERYQIGKKHFQEGRYRDALEELQKIAAVDPHFNNSLLTLISEAKTGLSKLEEQEKKRKEEEAIAERRSKIKALIAKAADYVKDHRAELAQDVFNDVAKLDPENIEISRLKREMDDWTREKQKKELEIAQKKKDREDKIEKLKPGKTLFLQKEWFKASGKLDEFLKVKDMDEDLTKEATEMLKTSREEVTNAVSPLQGKAKSLMEGQDLKGAYEVYLQILKIEPSNSEALNSVGEIKDILNAKARKIYREAIISESLSLFQDAKEKFQEVQQVSPVDSDYYKRATDKLKDYLE